MSCPALISLGCIIIIVSLGFGLMPYPSVYSMYMPLGFTSSDRRGQRIGVISLELTLLRHLKSGTGIKCSIGPFELGVIPMFA